MRRVCLIVGLLSGCVSEGRQGYVNDALRHIRGDNRYIDIDGNGTFDAMIDDQDGNRIPKILFDGQAIQIEDQKSLFHVAPGEKIKVWGIGRTEEYMFEGGTWRQVKIGQ